MHESLKSIKSLFKNNCFASYDIALRASADKRKSKPYHV